MRRYYLGIDGGQSSTTALIADETGKIAGVGRDGPCNHVTEEKAAAKFDSVIGGCLRSACAEAGLEVSTIEFAAACLGFSGGAEDKEARSRALIRSAKYKFTHDAEIALAGAMEGESGMIVIAGTGSMAFGRNREGRTARAGGWGYIFGDEGGAFDIVRQALRAALEFEEGWGSATVLLPWLLAETGAGNADKLLHLFYAPEYPRSRVASLAPLVDRAATEGDFVANRILDRAGLELARLVEAVYRNIFTAGASTGNTVRAAPIGGAFRSLILQNSFTRYVEQRIDCKVAPPRLSPSAGALLDALALDGNHSKLSGVPSPQK